MILDNVCVALWRALEIRQIANLILVVSDAPQKKVARTFAQFYIKYFYQCKIIRDNCQTIYVCK